MLLAAREGSPRWVVTLSILLGTTALSIDMSLPAQPAMARDLGVTSDVAQLTLSLFLAGYALGQIALGYASDALGRRRVLLAGLGLYTVAGVACAASQGIVPLLLARLAQGAGGAAAPVVTRAMVRDTQPAASAARIMSTMMAVLAVAPMIAPLLGGALLGWRGWHAIFAAHAAIGVAFTTLAAVSLRETLPAARRAKLEPRAIAAGFARFFRARGTILPTLLVCVSFTGQFAYIADSPFVLIEGYGIPPSRYGFYFAWAALALMAGSMLGRWLLRRLPPSTLLVVGGTTLGAGGLLVAASVHLGSFGAVGLVAPMVVYFVGIGLTGPSATAIAMDPVPEIAGTASSVIGCLQMLSGALSGFVATRLGGSDPRVLANIEAAVGLVAVALVAFRPSRARG